MKKKREKKSAAANLSNEHKQKVVNWLKDEDHDLLYNKRHKDYKDSANRSCHSK